MPSSTMLACMVLGVLGPVPAAAVLAAGSTALSRMQNPLEYAYGSLISIFHRHGSTASVSVGEPADAGLQGSLLVPEAPPQLPENPQISVVLPCAGEGEFAVKTALKVYERTPESVLKEILVVDDGSEVPMEAAFDKMVVDKQQRAQKRINIIRHNSTLGLMIAKKTGGDAATGDIVVFFDCHVSPAKNWHVEMSKLIKENPKRMVVPAITDLDLNSWEERERSAVSTKCYLTWDADFNWYDDHSNYVPIMSGGLLGLSKYWWRLTGGYDPSMQGWGGENLDQSLRSWLCGGEIMRAPTSRVAHMWRTNDQRTRAHYSRQGSAITNRERVVAAWYGPFKPMYRNHKNMPSFDLASMTATQQRLQCKPFVHFLHQFREVYSAGAVIPKRVFQIRHREYQLCLGGRGEVGLTPCNDNPHSQMWQKANKVEVNRTACCSGLRRWGTSRCLDGADSFGTPTEYQCDVSGQNRNQQYHFANGRIEHPFSSKCLTVMDGKPTLGSCALTRSSVEWEEINAFEPPEARIYSEELAKEGLVDEIWAAM